MQHPESSGKALAKRTLIQSGIVALVALVVILAWQAIGVVLVTFAGILLAVFFLGLADWLAAHTPLPRTWTLAIVLIGLALLVAAGVWFLAPEVSRQLDRLSDELPAALGKAQGWLNQFHWVRRLQQAETPVTDMLPTASTAWSTVSGVFSSLFGIVGNGVIVLAVGVFVALNPSTYREGLLHLVPPAQRGRAREVLRATAQALESWLLAKVTAMIAIGVLTTLGLWLLGIELALSLGLIAAALSFIPNFGPILAVIPALLIALIHGPTDALYVVLLYVGVQAFETYLLTPMLQQRMVSLPPAVTIVMQVFFGVLAGGLGLLLATPLTAAGMVMIRMLYVQDMLGDDLPDDRG